MARFLILMVRLMNFTALTFSVQEFGDAEVFVGDVEGVVEGLQVVVLRQLCPAEQVRPAHRYKDL
jgi:hypothetical protein